jgi:hypothetical protein
LMAAGPVSAPEIDASTGVAAVALLAGVIVIVHGRRRKG